MKKYQVISEQENHWIEADTVQEAIDWWLSACDEAGNEAPPIKIKDEDGNVVFNEFEE